MCLAAQFSFRTYFAGHARYFTREAVELIDHGVDGVLQLQDFAFYVDCDFARQIPTGNGRRYFGDVTHLTGKVSGHRVDRVGKIFPRSGHARHVRLPSQTALAAHLACHARDFAREAVELVHHGVQSFFELQDFAADVHCDLAGEVSAGDGRRHFGDVTYLACQVAGHEVHVIGEILPRTAYARHLGLAPQLAFRTYFAGHTGYFASEGVELIHHGVDGVFEFENFALHVNSNLARQIATRHSRRDFGDVADLGREVSGHGVDRVRQILPGSGDAGHHSLAAQFAVRTDFAGHAGDFGSERSELIHHRVDGFFELQDFAAYVDRNLAGEIAAGHGCGHFSDVAHLASQVAGHVVDVIGKVLPGSGDSRHLRLTAQLSFRTDFAGDARHLRGEDS